MNQDESALNDQARDDSDHEEELADKKGVRIKKNTGTDNEVRLNFTTYLISLGQTIQVALGKHPDPSTGQVNVNLIAASQFIDILKLLQEKTKGNLDKDEQALLDALLYELQLQFVAVKQMKSN